MNTGYGDGGMLQNPLCFRISVDCSDDTTKEELSVEMLSPLSAIGEVLTGNTDI